MGFTRIQNNLLELMSTNYFTDSERRILLCVVRKTIGYNKIWDKISLSQFEAETGLSRTIIKNSLNALVLKSALGKKVGNAITPNSWRVLEVVPNNTLVLKSALPRQKVVSKSDHTKESIQKKGTANFSYKENEEDIKKLFDTYNSLYGRHLGISSKENFSYWNKYYTVEQMIDALRNAKQHDFWKDIIDPVKLLRRKNPKGESIDRIGEFLKVQPKEGSVLTNEEMEARIV